MHVLMAAGMAASLVVPAGDGGAGAEGARLAQLVREVRTADYRGERGELSRLASALDGIQGPAIAAPAPIRRGFGLWRRAQNGFNETPLPGDLRADLEGAVKSFRAALSRRPEWVEPKIGASGCLMNLLYLSREDAAWRQQLVEEFRPLWAEVT